jgi:membrane associated rhomboid family serine protease
MTSGFDPTEIIACAIRPTGSWSHLSALIGFVVVAWFVSPRLAQRPARENRSVSQRRLEPLTDECSS